MNPIIGGAYSSFSIFWVIYCWYTKNVMINNTTITPFGNQFQIIDCNKIIKTSSNSNVDGVFETILRFVPIWDLRSNHISQMEMSEPFRITWSNMPAFRCESVKEGIKLILFDWVYNMSREAFRLINENRLLL